MEISNPRQPKKRRLSDGRRSQRAFKLMRPLSKLNLQRSQVQIVSLRRILDWIAFEVHMTNYAAQTTFGTIKDPQMPRTNMA